MTDRLGFVVIGVQKSATTWINDCLKEHPELNVKREKNEDFYYSGPVYKKNGSKWYWSLFDNSDGLKGCVSVDYFVDPEIPKILNDHNPSLKLILSIRHPIERTISAYYWYLRKSLIPDMPLDDAIEVAIKDYKAGNQSSFSELISRSLYASDVERFLEVFETKQLMVIDYFEISNDPRSVLERIFEFLNVSKKFTPTKLNSKPKQNTYNSALIKIQRLSSSKVMGKIADLLNQAYSKLRSSKPNTKPVLSDALKSELRLIYRKDILELSNLAESKDAMHLKGIVSKWEL